MTVFEFPGNITQYYFTEAMSDAGTHVSVLGEGEGSTMIYGESNNDDLLALGFARWDVHISRKDIHDQTIIDSVAALEAVKRRPPMPVIKLQVKSNLEPVFGSYGLGDTCGISIQDPRFPNGIFLRKRLLKWELTPQSSENAEEASLVFEGDPDV
jgi:hypothetical protein